MSLTENRPQRVGGRSRWVALLVTLPLVAVACMSTETVQGEPTTSSTPTPAATSESVLLEPTPTVESVAAPPPTVESVAAKPASGRWAKDLLAFQPARARGGSGSVWLVNLDRFYERNGVDTAEVCNDPNDFNAEEYMGLLGRAVGPQSGRMGFDIRSVATIGTAYTMLTDRDPAEIANAAANDPAWNDVLERTRVDGLEVFDWGSESSAETVSALRVDGEGGQLVIGDGIVARSKRDLESILDPGGPLLIDEPQVRGLIELIDNEGAHAMSLSNGPYFTAVDLFGVAAGLEGDERIDAIDKALMADGLAPYLSMGYGLVVPPEGGDDRLVVVFGHLNAVDAQKNVARFEQVVTTGSDVTGSPWSDALTLIDIRTEDEFLVATLISANGDSALITAGQAEVSAGSLFGIGAFDD